jgi:hypothetical protein
MDDLPHGERSPVIVFACARTGSTLLLRILNCLPKTIVWGEHDGFLTPLFHSYILAKQMLKSDFVKVSDLHLQTVLNREAVPRGEGMTIEWLNWLQEDDVDHIFRTFLLDAFLPPVYRGHFSRWGFKEIRYGMHEYTCLRALYPNFTPIVMLRHPAQVLMSQYNNITPNDPVSFSNHVAATEDFFNFAKAVAANSLVVIFEQLCFNPHGFNPHACCRKIAEYLDEELNPEPLSLIVKEIEASPGIPITDNDVFYTWLAAQGIEIPPERFDSIIDDYNIIISLSK